MDKRRPMPAAARRRRLLAGGVVGAVVLTALGFLSFLGDEPEPTRPKPVEQPMGYQWQPARRADPAMPLPEFAIVSAEIESLYRFALARPDLLTYIPCTCGCGREGHRSNWNCYIKSVSPDGHVVFDDMAPG